MKNLPPELSNLPKPALPDRPSLSPSFQNHLRALTAIVARAADRDHSKEQAIDLLGAINVEVVAMRQGVGL